MKKAFTDFINNLVPGSHANEDNSNNSLMLRILDEKKEIIEKKEEGKKEYIEEKKEIIKKEENIPFKNIKDSDVYIEIKALLLEQKEGERTLSFHFNGTGGTKDAECPTRVAFCNHGTPCLFFDGLGSNNDIPSVLRSTNDIELKKQESSQQPSGFNVLSNPWSNHYLQLDQLSRTQSGTVLQNVTNNQGVTFAEQVFGIGKKQNKDVTLNILCVLAEDGIFVDHFVWTGHSRGAQACGYTADKVDQMLQTEKLFKGKTKVTHDFVLTDPVPGPLGQDKEDVSFPEGTRTINIFYAPKEEKIFFKPYDLSKYKVPKNAVVTALPIPETTHISITSVSSFVNVAARMLVTVLTPRVVDKNNDDTERMKFFGILNIKEGKEKIAQEQFFGEGLCYIRLNSDQKIDDHYKQRVEKTIQKQGKSILLIQNRKLSIAYWNNGVQVTALECKHFEPLLEEKSFLFKLLPGNEVTREMRATIKAATGTIIRAPWSSNGNISSGNRKDLEFLRQDPLNDNLPPKLKETITEIRAIYNKPFEMEKYYKHLVGFHNVYTNISKQAKQDKNIIVDYIGRLNNILKGYSTTLNEDDKKIVLTKLPIQHIKDIKKLLSGAEKQNDELILKNEKKQSFWKEEILTDASKKMTKMLLQDIQLILPDNNSKTISVTKSQD